MKLLLRKQLPQLKMLKMTTDLPFIKKITQNPKSFSREKKSPSYLKPYLNLNQPPSFLRFF